MSAVQFGNSLGLPKPANTWGRGVAPGGAAVTLVSVSVSASPAFLILEPSCKPQRLLTLFQMKVVPDKLFLNTTFTIKCQT